MAQKSSKTTLPFSSLRFSGLFSKSSNVNFGAGLSRGSSLGHPAAAVLRGFGLDFLRIKRKRAAYPRAWQEAHRGKHRDRMGGGRLGRCYVVIFEDEICL